MRNFGRQPKARNLWLTLLKLIISLAILAYILTSQTNLGQVYQIIRLVNWRWLIIAFSLHAIGLLISAFRWQILTRAQGDNVPLLFLIQSYLVGTFFNNFLPTRFGGDIVRIWDGTRYSRTLVKSSAIIIVERLTGLFILFLFALIVALIRVELANQSPFIWIALAFGAVGFALILAFIIFPWPYFLKFLLKRKKINLLLEKVVDFRQTIINYRYQKRAFILAMLLALALQLNVIIYYFLIGQSLRLSVPFLDYFMVIPVVHFIQLIPITINGLGLREGAYIEIFSFYSIPAQASFSFSLIDVGFVLILGLIGGIIYILRK
ncbi:MAG: flippase-like domain-containing protein [Candidatus Aminicenantes bacterium]|nr:flippase-like domain-containing protein [Candidatus Aminicenantes bacterium]